MMDPLSMAFGGIGSIANIFSAQQTANNNAYIAGLNYKNQQDQLEAEKQAAANQEQFRNQQYGDTKLGFTDAAGNREHFVEGQGWVIDETPEQQAIDQQQRALDSAQTAEQMQKLTVDAARQRQQSVDTAKNNYKASNLADTFARMMAFNTDADPTTQGNIDGLSAALAAKAKNADTISDAAEQAVRGTGGTNTFGTLAGRVGNSDLANIAAAFAGGQTSGRQDALKENSANDADWTNLFNNYAGQAKTPVGGSQISPVGTNIYGDTGLSNAATQSAAQMNNDANQLGSAMSEALQHATIPQMSYEQPNNAIGNALTSLGGLFASNKSTPGQSSKYTSKGISFGSLF